MPQEGLTLNKEDKKDLNKRLNEIIEVFAFFLTNAKRATEDSNKTCAQRSRVTGMALVKLLKEWRQATLDKGLSFKSKPE